MLVCLRYLSTRGKTAAVLLIGLQPMIWLTTVNGGHNDALVALALLGAVAGAALARALLALARGWRPVSYAAVDDVQLDGTMLALAVLLAACTAVLFGLIPALVRAERSRSLGMGPPGDAMGRLGTF